MNIKTTPNRAMMEQLLGRYLLISGEIDMFISLSQSFFTGHPISKNWGKKDLADKLRWYGQNLDLSVSEHASLVGFITTVDVVHRPFRNMLAHSTLTLDVETNAFHAMNANGLEESIAIETLYKKVQELEQLNQDINGAIALSASVHNKNKNA